MTADLIKLGLLVINNKQMIEQVQKNYTYTASAWFQNRGKPLQMMDTFLLNENRQIMMVLGTTLIGKKSLIWQALSKFKHNRIPISIKVTAEISAVSIFEQVMTQLQIGHFLDVELLASSWIDTALVLDLLKDTELIGNIVGNTILILNEIENACDGLKNLENYDLYNFLKLWTEYPTAKIIIDSNYEINNIKNIASNVLDKIGLTLFKSMDDRFGENQYPVQMLQELIPMDYRLKENSIGGFPEQLLFLINNHPHIAYVSAMAINQNEDKLCLQDSTYIAKLQSKILKDLMDNFKISKKEMEFINILLILDASYTIDTLSYFSNFKLEKNSLIDKGVLNKYDGQNYRLLKIFTLAEDVNEHLDFSVEYKQKMNIVFMDMFKNLFHKTSNPSYYRKHIYFTLLCGQSTPVTMYSLEQATEIAEHYFHEKSYDLAIKYFNEIGKIKPLYSKQAMRKASCFIRLGEVTEGLTLYNDLFIKYPSWHSIRNSCVDALLFNDSNKHAKKAIEILVYIPPIERTAYWYFQHARANRELLLIDDTFSSLDKAIKLEVDTHKAVYRLLEAISFSKEIYDRTRTEEYISWLESNPYCNYPEAQIEIGSHFEKTQNYPKALLYLESAYKERPTNPYCMLSLIKTYCALDRIADAEKIINEVKDSPLLKDNEIVLYSQVYFCQCTENFDDGEKLLFMLMKSNENHMHFITQWTEFYLKKCRANQYTNRGILSKAAKYKKQILDSINIPALLLLLNVYKLLNDECTITEIKHRIAKINSAVDVVNL